MYEYLTNLKLVLLSLFVLNLAAVLLFKQEFRFVKGQIILLSLILSSFLVYRFAVYPAVKTKNEAAKQAAIKQYGWDYINQPDLDRTFIKKEQQNETLTRALLKITGLQAAFAFVFAVIGFFLTAQKRLYGFYALLFLVVSFLFLN